MATKKKGISPLEKPLNSLLCTPTRFVNMVMRAFSNAIKHQPDSADLIKQCCKSSVVALLLLRRFPALTKRVICTPEFLQKSNWMIFLAKLRSSATTDPNMLPMLLFRTLLQESISKEKDYKPFWMPACKELSERLWLPTEIGSVDSGLSCSSTSLQKEGEPLLLLTTKNTKHPIKNLQRICSQSSMYTLADKWEREVIPEGNLKTLRIRLKPTKQQRMVVMDWMNTSRFVYNKAVSAIHSGKKPNMQSLRTTLVTANTKTHNPAYVELNELRSKKFLVESKAPIDNVKLAEIQTRIVALKEIITKTRTEMPEMKNEELCEWELDTPKAIRDGAVDDACKAVKSGIAALKVGAIRHFNLGFRKKTNMRQSSLIPKSLIKNKEGILHIAPTFLKKNKFFKMGKRTAKKYKDLIIEHDCRIVYEKHEYWLMVPVPMTYAADAPLIAFCGVDPGVRTMLTVFGSNGVTEYTHDSTRIEKLDTKIEKLKYKPRNKCAENARATRVRKSKLNAAEKQKKNLIEELQWKTIAHLLQHNDVIFFGDIKSHGIVKNGKNHTLNKSLNNLKFFQFKQKLLFKASEKRKRVYMTKEHFTSKTCSSCGMLNDPKKSKIYYCGNCKKHTDRDINAAKNILIRGIIGC